MKAIISVFDEKEYKMKDIHVDINSPNQEMNAIPDHIKVENAPSKISEHEYFKRGYNLALAQIECEIHHQANKGVKVLTINRLLTTIETLRNQSSA